MRSDVAFVVVELRGIGRRLVAGSWSRHAKPMDVTRAIAVMAEALTFVVDAGVGSVLERGKQMMSDLAAGRLPADRQPLNFDEDD